MVTFDAKKSINVVVGSNTQCGKNVKFTLTEIKIREINSLVKSLLSRNFCQIDKVRVNFRNFHTVQRRKKSIIMTDRRTMFIFLFSGYFSTRILRTYHHVRFAQRNSTLVGDAVFYKIHTFFRKTNFSIFQKQQCEKFSILLSFRFYVKSILENDNVQKMPFLQF